MISHEQAVYALEHMLPGTQNHIDYLIGHPIDPVTGAQTEQAFVVRWKCEHPEPSMDAIEAAFAPLAEAFNTSQQALIVRHQRSLLFVKADAEVAKALDNGNMTGVTAWGAYRKALRDIPTQPGFPHTVVWPEQPTEA
jgi:hypothetical protein